MKTPNTSFDWTIYADATFAGLAVLIPLPPLDLIAEWYFRRRMLRTIAKRQGVSLKPEVITVMQRSGCFTGCITWPIVLIFLILKRISRKILYFLTIKEATDMLSHYWHQAFLYNYMIAAGHLEQVATAEIARLTVDETLAEAKTSPLTKVALQVVENGRHIWRTLRRVWRRDEEDEVVAESRSLMDEQWDEATRYLNKLAAEYQRRFDSRLLDQQIQLFAQETQSVQFEPLTKGSNQNDPEKINSTFQAEERQAQTGTGTEIDSRRYQAPDAPSQEESDR